MVIAVCRQGCVAKAVSPCPGHCGGGAMIPFAWFDARTPYPDCSVRRAGRAVLRERLPNLSALNTIR